MQLSVETTDVDKHSCYNMTCLKGYYVVLEAKVETESGSNTNSK